MLELNLSETQAISAIAPIVDENKPLTQRNELGQLMPGSVNAPNGCKGNSIFSKAALDKMHDRFLMEYTYEELKALFDDKQQFNKLPTAQVIVITRIMGASEPTELGMRETNSIYDRKHGKVSGDAPSVNVQVNIGGSPSDDEILARYYGGMKSCE